MQINKNTEARPEPLIKLTPTARWIGLSAPTVRRKALNGLIPFYSLDDGKTMLFRLSEVEAALRANAQFRR